MSSTENVERRGPSYLPSLLTFVIVLALMFAGFLYGRSRANRGLYSAIESQGKKAELVSSMLADLHASADAEKAAVMAETDEASIAFAEEARQASSHLEASRLELERLIQLGNRPQETAALTEFNPAWKTYQDLEHDVLSLAVENTNLKAQRLSFGPARDALTSLESALNQLHAPSAEANSTTSIAADEALLATFKIYALEPRHIAEARDEEMDRLEAEMQTLDAQAMSRLSSLASHSPEDSQAAIEKAKAAYAKFQQVNAEIIGLSRKNSNVRSAALSLGKKRNATAACRDLLQSLREAVQDEGSRATR